MANIQRATTSSVINNLVITPGVGDIVETLGYSSKGDGGGAQWKFNGVTGQTPSQTPAQLGDGLLNDGSGNQWELVCNGNLSSSSLGVKPDEADNYLQLISCLNFAKRLSIGFIDLPSGNINTSGELVVTSEGTTIQGQGAGTFKDGIVGYKTRLIGTGESGSVIRLQIESCKIKNLLIDSSGDRLLAERDFTKAGFNCGVRIEGLDVAPPEGDVFDSVIDNVHVINQPNDGIVIVARCGGTVIKKSQVTNCNGQGIVLTNGEHTNRVNTRIAGIVSVYDSNVAKCAGHGIRAGKDNDTDYTFRIHVVNTETLNNMGDPSITEGAYEAFYHTDGLTVLNGASTGADKSGVISANVGYGLRGRGGTIIEPRILDTSIPIEFINGGSRGTEGWNVIGPHIRTTSSAYLCKVDPQVENLTIISGDETGALTSATDIESITGLNSTFNGIQLTNLNTRVKGSLSDDNGLNLIPEYKLNQQITATPRFIFDASPSSKMWRVSLRHTGDPCLSSCTFDVVGGSVPVVSNIVNQSGAFVTFIPNVNGTDIELTTSAGSRNSDIYIKELVTD